MPWSPVAGLIPQYQRSDGALASDYYLKFYQEGTVTPLSMAINDTGSSTLAKCKLNSSGEPVNGSDAPFIPYINADYKIALFKNSTDADNNTTANAQWVEDVVPRMATINEVNASFNKKIAATYAEIRALDSSELTDGDSITLTGDKIAGTFTVKTGTVTDNAGTLIVFTDNANRYAERTHMIGFYNAFWWCNADGTTDDAANIAAADAAATAAGRSLFFPKAEYAISVQSAQAGVTATASWMSYGATLKNTNLALDSGQFLILYDGVDDFSFDGFVLDGQITITGSSTANEDQSSPSDANADSYTQCAGLAFRTCTNATVRNCQANNFWRAGFRSEIRCKGITYENCRTNRNRGEFGDSFYVTFCRDIKINNCSAYDFTRIGFVYEGVVGSLDATDMSIFSNLYAEYAHDNISSENNCGYWLENANEIQMNNLTAVNTVGGAVLSGTESDGYVIDNSGEIPPFKTFNLNGFTGISLDSGIGINPDNGKSVFNISNVNVQLTSATSFNGTFPQTTGRSIFEIQVGDVDFQINISNAFGYIPNSGWDAATAYAFLGILEPVEIIGKKQKINLTDCQVEFEDAAAVRTDALSGNGKGFLASYGSCSTSIKLTNCEDRSDSLERLPISLTSYDDRIDLSVYNSNPQFIKSSGDCAKISIYNADRVDTEVQTRADIVRLYNSDVKKVNFDTSDAIINGGTCEQWVQKDDAPLSTTLDRPVIFKANGVSFLGDLANESTVLFQTTSTDRHLFMFMGCEFYQKGTGTVTNYFIDSSNASYGEFIGAGNYFDNRVTNYARLFSSGTPIIKALSGIKSEVDADMPFGISYNISF